MEVEAVKVETFDSACNALADIPADSANMKVRFEVLSVLEARIRSWNMSQEAAAARLGITRPRLNDLLRGKVRKFSLDALINIAPAAGFVVEIRIAEAA